MSVDYLEIDRKIYLCVPCRLSLLCPSILERTNSESLKKTTYKIQSADEEKKTTAGQKNNIKHCETEKSLI